MTTSPLVELRGVHKAFGKTPAVHPLDLSVEAGELLAILGPSGCGKTTLLRMIAGFVAPDGGSIRIDNVDVTRLGPDRRPTNMVFQGYGLFPHMSVEQNVGYGLRLQRLPRTEVAERVQEALRLVALGDMGRRAVNEISGGQQQRVALARALVMRPRVLLLDEPLAALDLKLRRAMQDELREIHRSIGGTFIFVTHDQEEAMSLATRIIVMEAGRISQHGTPEEIYRRPRTKFVSTFIGDANLLPARRAGGVVSIGPHMQFPQAGPDSEVIVVVRPSALRFVPCNGASTGASHGYLSGTLKDVVFLGAQVKFSVQLDDGPLVHVASPDPRSRESAAPGAQVRVAWDLDSHCIVTDD